MASWKSLGPALAGALIVALGTLAAAPARADDQGAPSIITARGTGEVRCRPDSVRVDVGAEAQASTLDEAREQVNSAVTRVLGALRALNLPDLVIETQDLRFNPVYGPPREGQPPAIVGYAATNHVLVTSKRAPREDLADRSAKIVDAALTAGANLVGGLNFFLADPTGPEGDALAQAVQNARRDAEIMARAAHVTLTGPVSIEEAAASRVPRSLVLAAAPVASTPIEVGDIVIQSNVTARFAFNSP
jgi:uncharacterized protein YggE